jgi:excisionase family DNA binding protein
MIEETNNGENGNALVSYKEAAAMLKVCGRTLRRKVDDKLLAIIKIGGRRFFHLSDILRIQKEGIL